MNEREKEAEVTEAKACISTVRMAADNLAGSREPAEKFACDLLRHVARLLEARYDPQASKEMKRRGTAYPKWEDYRPSPSGPPLDPGRNRG